MRRCPCLLVLALLSLAFAPAPLPRPDPLGTIWESVKVVSLRDFDDLEVIIQGDRRKAFLVGLRPLREAHREKAARQRIRKEALAELEKSALFAQVVTRRGEALGLSVDAFLHHRNGFKPGPNQGKYLNVTGWGAYNFNLYFLHRRYTTPHDNFGENQRWRDTFNRAVGNKGAKGKVSRGGPEKSLAEKREPGRTGAQRNAHMSLR